MAATAPFSLSGMGSRSRQTAKDDGIEGRGSSEDMKRVSTSTGHEVKRWVRRGVSRLPGEHIRDRGRRECLATDPILHVIGHEIAFVKAKLFRMNAARDQQ